MQASTRARVRRAGCAAVGRARTPPAMGWRNSAFRSAGRRARWKQRVACNAVSQHLCLRRLAGPYQFTHTASTSLDAAVNALFAASENSVRTTRRSPWATFTDPEVARVGLNETERRNRMFPHEVSVFGIEELDRAIATAWRAHGEGATVPARTASSAPPSSDEHGRRSDRGVHRRHEAWPRPEQ